jgi:acetylornithine/succinyldiaminopimelate/putrescine aminotransferase
MLLDRLQIVKGRNEILVATDGREYVDLICGFGAVLLGHGNPPIVARVRQQLDDVWLTSRIRTPSLEEATSLVNASFGGEPYRLLQFCSSGNEAVEFAMRIAAVATERTGFVGFSRSMHGKSLAASAMSWASRFVELRNVTTLPFVSTCSEPEVLERLRSTLAARNVAGVFLELIQGTSGGHEASATFYRDVALLCREHGTLCIVDEILTGFYRSGSLRYSRDIGISPDILIFGKALGNGFPVAAVVGRDGIEITSAMLPGSTYSGNPLAASAVAATLTEMARAEMAAKVAAVHRATQARLGELREHGIALRGRGALWILELADATSVAQVQHAAFSRNVLVSAHGKCIRLLPPATISAANLDRALDVVGDSCLESLNA